MLASVSFDSEYNILYIKFSDNKAVKAIPITQDQHIDVDEDGKAVGMEFMMPDSIPEEATQALLRIKEKITLTH